MLFTHVFGYLFYMFPQQLLYIRTKSLYTRSVLLTPADVYVIHMDISPDPTRSKNSGIPEWRNIREQLRLGGSLGRHWKSKCHSSQQWSDACGWGTAPIFPFQNAKWFQGYIKLETVVPWVGSVVSTVSHKLSRSWLYHSKIYVFISLNYVLSG